MNVALYLTVKATVLKAMKAGLQMATVMMVHGECFLTVLHGDVTMVPVAKSY